MRHHEILGVAVWEENRLTFHNTAPCFNLEQLEALGQELHSLFSGYQSMERCVSGLALQYDERYLQILVLKKQEAPVYIVAITENPQALAIALEVITTWTVEALFEKTKRAMTGYEQPRASTQQLWSHFLLRLKTRLESSLGPESGSELLFSALAAHDAGPTKPLPDDQWLAFAQHVADQITDPQALQRFNQLHSEPDNMADS